MYVCIFINAFRVKRLNEGVNSLLLSGNNNSIQSIPVLTLYICGFYYKFVSFIFNWNMKFPQIKSINKRRVYSAKRPRY